MNLTVTIMLLRAAIIFSMMVSPRDDGVIDNENINILQQDVVTCKSDQAITAPSEILKSGLSMC